MTLRHMKIFTTVFRCGSVTRAAEELHLAQPTLSVAIQEIEKNYGVRLFERTGRKLMPTQAANTLYSYASHIVTLFDSIEKLMCNWDTLGVLRVGASITIGTHILPSLIRRYHSCMPELQIEAVVERSSGIEQRLIDNEIDIGLIETQPVHSDLMAIPFLHDELCAIVPMDSALAGENTVSLKQLAEYPFLMREPGSSVRQILDACFSLMQMTVHPVWQSASTQAIVSAVGEGLGVSVLPRMLVSRDAHEQIVRMLPIEKPLQREMNIVFHKKKYLTQNMKEFIDLCQEPLEEAEEPWDALRRRRKDR